MRLTARLIVALLFVTPCVAVRAAEPVAAPTIKDIQADFDAQKYQDALKKITQVIPLANKPNSEYDKAKLYELKAESHLRLKQQQPASEAFGQAAKAATDDKQVAMDTSMGLLVKKSQNLKYTPKQPTTKPAGGKPEPIDIVEAKSRKDALAALFNDESKTSLAKVEALKKQTSLKPLMEGIKDVSEIHMLELAATGSDATTKTILASLGDHANTLMGTAVKQMGDKVEQISRQANETHSSQQALSDGTTQIVTEKRGITSADASVLKDVIATCKNISSACDEFAKALGADGSGAGFAATKGQSDQVATKADQVLRADYSPDVKGGSTTPRPGRIGGSPQQPPVPVKPRGAYP